MRTKYFFRILISLLLCSSSFVAQESPKREFRGVWMHTVFNEDYPKMNSNEIKEYLIKRLDEYQALGINVVIFQVRPEGDAFYKSSYEPWSRYLTGTQGKAPSPFFDPMEFLISECHKRGMEFHAWVNPYRASASKKNSMCENNLYKRKRYLFAIYGDQIFFNPGLPENRTYFCSVIKDIVSRYDVDAIHMDDYFYPYPLKGLEFPDTDEFKKYGVKTGEFSPNQKKEWRRNNVSLLIKEVSETIKKEKPWVKFGISPFGIYRNKRDWNGGSDTKGLSNYDDLYADILLWMKNSWIDYNIPQVYWEIGHKLADYETLVSWWSENSYNTHLYIGQDVERTMNTPDKKYNQTNQLERKMLLTRQTDNVLGNCFWSGDYLLKNKAFKDSMKANYHKNIALVPVIKSIDSIPPKPVYDVEYSFMGKDPKIVWKVQKATNEMDKAFYFCVYAFEENEEMNIKNPAKLVKIVHTNEYILPENESSMCYKYVITALDRLENESEPSKPLFID